ncbi:hypothetical protein Verru16b_03534 [Lacunisphaera limnophila]|uniref:Uncharacterized protein n=1 Tax=Lacunisphaera limnophila TaxID=1838286 RepID=A0A1D8AZV6_9BACT|nr:hypothetical protein [Lacunisphaera limnophila]AOS46428.1 hypothetical protein Verru16b_03534 [Lacunisphaera limnophila]
MSDTPDNTSAELMAVASETLMAGGYRRIEGRFTDWDTSHARLFEDKYNVVGVAIFDSCTELLQSWPDLQGSLVEIISQNVAQTESKSWDGYLVLLTPAVAPSESAQLEHIRYDTNRIRKLVASGVELKLPGAAARVLRPLLPLNEGVSVPAPASVLDLLPDLLARSEVPRNATEAVLKAFKTQAPIMDQLHETLTKK